MSSSRYIGARIVAAVLAIAVTGACRDEPPVGLPAESPAAQTLLDVANISVDSLYENPISLGVAKEVPSFGGLYFDDDGQLVVALTDLSRLADAEGQIRARLGYHGTARGDVDRATVRLIAREVEYPFLDLARYRQVLRGHVFAIPDVVSLGVKQSTNRVTIGVANAAAEARVKLLLSTLGIPEAVVTFSLVPRVQLSSTSLSHTLDGRMGNIQGGWQIDPWNTCTLGFAARRTGDGSPVFVTNSHCTYETGNDGGPVYQSIDHIGNEILDPPAFSCLEYFGAPCRHSDAALFSALVPMDLGMIARTTDSTNCDECHATLIINDANPTLLITGESGHIIENEYLHKIGQTTGWTYGPVEDTCTDFYGNNDLWILCSDRVDYSSDGGDSGAPVFFKKADGTVVLKGIHFAETAGWTDTYNDAMMSNIGQIERDLGPLTVFVPTPARMELNPATKGVKIDSSAYLMANVWDYSGSLMSSPSVTWYSTNPAVATVSGTSSAGYVTGVELGTVLIIAEVVGHGTTYRDTTTVFVLENEPHPPVFVDIVGPSSMEPYGSCVWWANASQGSGTYTNYEWTANGQPVGGNSEFLNYTMGSQSVELAVVVTDSNNRSSGASFYVEVQEGAYCSQKPM
jgi:hypothetical protein